MPDQTQMLGVLPVPPGGTAVAVEPPDSASIDIELGEFAAAALCREKAISLSDEARAGLIARIERAQAARGARLARQAWEARPVPLAPAVGPDTVWSGDYGVLLDLFRLGLYRLNVSATYLSEHQRHCAPLGFLAHVEP